MAGANATRLALRALSLARIARLLPWPGDAKGFVVTLHHVRPTAPGSGFRPNAHLEVTPAFLGAFLEHFSARGWSFVSLEELLAGEGRHRIAVTLDDGYRDNAVYALPVFRRHRAPFTIFVSPGLTEATTELWWEALERMIGENAELRLEGAGPSQHAAGTPAEKQRLFMAWLGWLTTAVDETRQREVVRELAAKYGVDLRQLARAQVMDWDEIRTLRKEPLARIGAHTMTHPALARLSADAALAEMRASADRIEAETGERPKTIAFPYGYPAAAGPREARLAAEAGFAASFTTQPGYVRAGESHGLPRVSLNGLYQEPALFEPLLHPAPWRLRARLKPRA